MISINDPYMTQWGHDSDEFGRVLFIAHREWHGIRNATAYLPGHKVLISCDRHVSQREIEKLLSFIEASSISKIVFQGYSDAADDLAIRLAAHVGGQVELFAVTHVTTAQFDNQFEMHMQARLFVRLQYGTIKRLGSVKPYFSSSFDQYYQPVILNFAPNISRENFMPKANLGTVFIPLDVSWRKNRYTNIIAALKSNCVTSVTTNNFPDGLESLLDLRKLQLVGYARGIRLLEMMSASNLVLNATLAECQPMTQLEAFSVGTLSATLPLRIPDFDDDELIARCEIATVDNVHFVSDAIGNLLHWEQQDPHAVKQMISDHLVKRHKIALHRYADFLGL